jgi:hypothetical protein
VGVSVYGAARAGSNVWGAVRRVGVVVEWRVAGREARAEGELTTPG